jgi:hypothetical protein
MGKSLSSTVFDLSQESSGGCHSRVGFWPSCENAATDDAVQGYSMMDLPKAYRRFSHALRHSYSQG